MNPTLLAFATCAWSLAYPMGWPTPVGWPDIWPLDDPWVDDVPPISSDDVLSPEGSTSDEGPGELVRSAESPWGVFVGCDLALIGSLTANPGAREFGIGAPAPTIVENSHGEKDGRWIDYEQIPRRADRPEAYLAYRYPLVEAPVVSGYDLDQPDDQQRRGGMNAVGHGGVDLVAEMGAPIAVPLLEHQVGDAEVLYVGPLYGETVVTRHVLREAGVDRDYLLLFGHLDRPGDGVRRGRRLADGETLGFVGNSASPGHVHLHLEARRVRDRIDAWTLPGEALHAREFSVVTDPRKVLPLKAVRDRSPTCAPRLVYPPRRYWLGASMALGLE